jgi:hypothetical protein
MHQINDLDEATPLTRDAIALWRECSRSLPGLGRQYSRAEQLEREMLFDECLDTIQASSFDIPKTESEGEAAYNRITSALAKIGTCAIDLEDPYVELLLRDGFSGIGSDLARWARSMDRCVSAADIFQACRNAWTACGLQLLLGRPIELTPAIFGYSMLYPYSDNFLDQADVSREQKLPFSSRFRSRLAGNIPQPVNALESAVWQFVGLIESQYPRAEYPRVYAALLSIHHAQEQSLSQLRRKAFSRCSRNKIDILELSFAKGGTSVLADAYLAAGSLSDSEIKFAFEWGVLLQLGDDLQDLRQDLDNESLTLFTQAAGSERLDTLTNQTLHFAQAVMTRMDGLVTAKDLIKELLKRSSRSLLIRAAAAAEEFYSREYVAELETYSPVSFAFLKARQEQFTRRHAWFEAFFEALVLQEQPTRREAPTKTFSTNHVLTLR